MINTISPSSKSGASKWMKPQSSQDQEYDANSQNAPLHSFFKGGPQKLMGSTSSGPVKALNILNPHLSSGEGSNSRENNQSNTNLNKSKRFELNIIPKRMALSFSPPPTIIMEYLVLKTGKLYHHKIKIRGLSWESDTEKVLEQVKRRHEMYLTKISDVKLLKLISILQERIGIEEGKISGVIKPQAQQNNINTKKETEQNRPQYNKEITSDDEDYDYDDFEDYAAYGDQEHSKRQDEEEEKEEEEEESNDVNDKKQEEENEESEEEKQRAGDFEFDAKAVFQSNGKDDGDVDDDQEDEGEEDEDEEDDNEEGEGENEEEDDEGQQDDQNEDSQEEGKLKNQYYSGDNKQENIKHNEKQEDIKLEEVKRNNFMDAKKEFDFFEDDEFGDSMEERKPQKKESSESEEEEDIYKQVKKQLDSQKGIKSQTVSSYKGNIQQQKYSIQHYIKDQNNNEAEEEDDEDQDQEEESQEKSQEDEQQHNNNNNQESDENSKENQSQEDELIDEVDYDNYDLNKLKREEVEMHKKMMDKQFEANRKKPGQIGFLYDMRMEFDPEESNDWDKSQNRMNTNEDNHVVDYDFV